jgi:hypothetical protein
MRRLSGRRWPNITSIVRAGWKLDAPTAIFCALREPVAADGVREKW